MATYRESFVVRIASDPVAIFWTGFGNIALPADNVLPDDVVVIGSPDLINVPDFQQLINGTAERLEAVLSGVSAEVERLAVADADSVRGAAVDIGRIPFDDDWQQLAVEWEATFEARKLSGSRGPTDDRGPSRSITLTLAAGDTTRSRSRNSHYTDADQRRRSDSDAIFDHVAGISAGTSRRWGPK